MSKAACGRSCGERPWPCSSGMKDLEGGIGVGKEGGLRFRGCAGGWGRRRGGLAEAPTQDRVGPLGPLPSHLATVAAIPRAVMAVSTCSTASTSSSYTVSAAVRPGTRQRRPAGGPAAPAGARGSRWRAGRRQPGGRRGPGAQLVRQLVEVAELQAGQAGPTAHPQRARLAPQQLGVAVEGVQHLPGQHQRAPAQVCGRQQ